MKNVLQSLKVDGDLRAPSGSVRIKNAPGGRVPPRIKCRWVALVAISALSARAIEITLPPETAKLAESPLPGYPLAVASCATCHSMDYVKMQPTSSRAYWKASVTKMQKTFGAPIPEEMVEPIVDYLVKTYGSERSAVAPAGSAQSKTKVTPAKK
jgi:hypothetical protein